MNSPPRFGGLVARFNRFSAVVKLMSLMRPGIGVCGGGVRRCRYFFDYIVCLRSERVFPTLNFPLYVLPYVFHCRLICWRFFLRDSLFSLPLSLTSRCVRRILLPSPPFNRASLPFISIYSLLYFVCCEFRFIAFNYIYLSLSLPRLIFNSSPPCGLIGWFALASLPSSVLPTVIPVDVAGVFYFVRSFVARHVFLCLIINYDFA